MKAWITTENQSNDWKREEEDSSCLICYETFNFLKLHIVENTVLESNLLVKCVFFYKTKIWIPTIIIVKNINNWQIFIKGI